MHITNSKIREYLPVSARHAISRKRCYSLANSVYKTVSDLFQAVNSRYLKSDLIKEPRPFYYNLK